MAGIAPSLEYCVEHADSMARQIVNSWYLHHPGPYPEGFQPLLDAACNYQNYRRMADNHRESNCLTDMVVGRETELRESFARSVKAYRDRRGV